MPSFLSEIHAFMYRDGTPQELNEEQEASKREMYERMSPRGRRFVDRIGYENWDPFQKPNDPLDIRQDATKRTTQQLVREFFQAVSNHAGMTLHIDNLKGENAHHQAESIFKAFARALRAAVATDARAADVIPSTKGAL